jgi:hypothetical protein
MEQRAARACVREEEEVAIKQATKENIQNIKTAQKEQAKIPKERVVISPSEYLLQLMRRKAMT